MQMRPHDENRSVYIVLYFEKSKTRNDGEPDIICKSITRVRQWDFELEPQSERSREERRIFQTRHEIFNGSELNRDGKVNFLISGDASLPAASVESAGKGNTEFCSSLSFTSATSRTHSPPHPEISRQPLPAISHPRNEPPSPRPL